MNRKTLLSIASFMMMAVMVNLISCTNEENVASNIKSDNIAEVYKASKLFIQNRDAQALSTIENYYTSEVATRATEKKDSSKLEILMAFEAKHNIQDSQLDEFLTNNPEYIDPLVESICSEAFVEQFREITNVYTPKLETLYVSTLKKTAELTKFEKSMLMLLVASENNYNPQTRSFSSCLKRYAKLTEIAVKATAKSTISFQDAVEYASDELDKMGPEYDC